MNQLVQLIKKSLFLLVFCVFSNSFGQAGNLNNDIGVFAAADINYECLGGGQYKITLDVYAECGYFDGSLNNKDNYPITIESKSLGIKIEPKVLKPTSGPAREGKEINIYCPDQPSQCDTRDQASFRGLKKYTFSTTVNLDQLGKANDWKVFWSRNNRSAEITTIGNNQPYHTEALINNTTVCNSTPTIAIESVFSIKKGIPETKQLGASDVNNNRLEYTIVSPLQGLNDPIDYNGGVSATQPFGAGKTISINGSGQLSIPAIDQAGVNANFDVLISEFNGNTKVGESRKSFQITTLETENTAPVISGINGTNDTVITVCAGDRLALALTGTDPDGDKMRFLGNPQIIPQKSIPFSRNTIDANPNFKYTETPSGTFNWQTTTLDVGVYTVVVTLEDNACPVNLTTTKEFTIRVNPIPTFSLGPDAPFNCDNPQVFDPEITNAVGNLSYSWSRWFVTTIIPIDTVDVSFQTEKKLELTGPGQFLLEVSDDAGCSKSDRIIIYESLYGTMGFYGRCIGQTTTFEDESAFVGSEFVSRKWTIETKAETTDEQIFTHKFPGLGSYDAQLIVEDKLGCIDTIDRVVEVVEEPIAALSLVDSCSAFLDGTYERGGVDFIDASIYQSGDGFGDVEWTISTLAGDELDVLVPPQPNGLLDRWFDYGFPDSGLYIIKTEINTSASCQASKIDTVHIVQRPKLKLISDSVYSINCANPDTVFQVTLDDHFIGTSGYEFWYFDQDSVKSDVKSFIDPKSVFDVEIDTVGVYTIWVKDSKGCEHFQSVEVEFSTEATLGYELQCSEGAIQFRDLSIIDTTDRTIISWDWDFGDNSSSNLQEPTHLYSAQGDYQTILTVTDSKGCTNSDTLKVYYSFPKSDLKVTPDIEVVKLCVSDQLTASNLVLTAGTPYHIDDLVWRFQKANGSLDTFYYDNFPTDPLMITKGLVQQYILADTTSQLKIENEVTYNRNIANPVSGTSACNKVFEVSKDFTVFPEFKGDIFDNRVCLGDSAIFRFDRSVNKDILVESVTWTFRSSQTGVIIAQTTDLDPQVFIDENEFTRGPGQMGVTARFVDVNGCVLNKVATFEVDEVTSKPNWDFDEIVCRGEKVLFTLKADQGDVDYWQVNQNFSDSLIAGNFIAPTFDQDVVGSPQIVFDEPGVFPVSMFLIKNVSIQSGKICRARIDDTIRVNDVPSYNIEWDTVCSAVSPTTFINSSTINGNFGKVVDYRWDFGDGSEQVITPAGQVEVKHRYANGGNFTVKVTATTEEQCNQSDTTFSIYVRPTPIAKYETDQEFMEANELITFMDASETYGAYKDSIFWDFGYPGKFNGEIVSVEWDTVNVYQVYHYIKTSDGCEDDTTYRIDLNTYLDLPNAFSPNNDGTNDELFLIYKSIEELYTYKIYNRWGQEIFDAEGDLTRGWDGTYNGTDQEVGVYVAHVKARGAYDTLFNFKVNVRLIR